MSDEQKPGDPADKVADGAFGGVQSHRAGYGDDKLARVVAWLRANPSSTLASGEGALLLAEIDRLKGQWEVEDVDAHQYYCLSSEHRHPTRAHEAFCSARYQLTQALAEIDRLNAQWERQTETLPIITAAQWERLTSDEAVEAARAAYEGESGFWAQSSEIRAAITAARDAARGQG